MADRWLAFRRWPVEEKSLFAEAVVALFFAKLILLLLPFKHCVKLLEYKKGESRTGSVEELAALKQALDRANRLAFWKNECLVKSFAARKLLMRRGIASRMAVGVAHDEAKKVIAHAWITAGDFELVKKELEYKELWVLR